MRKQAPEIVAEWTKSSNPIGQALGRAQLERLGVSVPDDAGLASIGPLTIRQLNLFAHKVVLGLYFEKFREPLPNDGGVWATWRTKEEAIARPMPPGILEIMPQYGTLKQGKWNAQDTFEYQFDTNPDEGLLGCFAILRGLFAVVGFAIKDAASLPPNEAMSWQRPHDLLSKLNDPDFARRL